MKKKIVSSKEIVENNFSLSPSDYIEVYVPESVTVVFTLQPTGSRLYVDNIPYHEDDRLCVSEAIIKLTTEQGINVDVMEYSWEVLIV